MGWKKEQEGVWFDADLFTEKTAFEQFDKIQDTDQRGFPYTKYVYQGREYYDVVYLGLFKNDEMPHIASEYMDYLVKAKQNNKDD